VTGYLVSPQARQDLFEITDYIANDNLDAALRLRDRLFAAFDRLAKRPGLGHVRTDLVPAEFGVRFWSVGTYLIIYRPAEPVIQIVRVLSGYRDIATVLSQASD
jgi:plasmid stabilization system protein ParE